MQSLNNNQPMHSIPANSATNKSIEEHKKPTFIKIASTFQEYY
jgi:hypothetical protein